MAAAVAPRAFHIPGLAALGKAVGYVVLFVLFLAASVVAHVDVPVARKMAAKELSDGLATMFAGKIVLEHVDDLGVKGLRGADAYVVAPDGTKVIVAHGLRARIDPLKLLRAVLGGRGVISVFDIDIDEVEVVLDVDSNGEPKIARAFALMKPTTTDSKGQQINVELPSVHVRHGWIHGAIPGAPIIDADADNVQGAVHVGDKVTVEVSHVDLRTRALPFHANATGVVTGHVAVPSPHGNQVGFEGKFDGLVGEVPTRADVGLDGNDWHVTADVPSVDTAKVRAMVPTAPVYGTAALHAEAIGPLDALRVGAHATLNASTVDANVVLGLTHDITVKGHVDAADVDLRSFAPTAPPSQLSAHVDADLVVPDGKPLHGTFALTSPPGSVQANAIPATELHGTFEQGVAVGRTPSLFTATAEGKVHEPGAPTDVKLLFHQTQDGGTLDVDAHTVVPSLASVPRIGFVGAGQADAVTKGVITIAATPHFDANVRASVNGFRRDALRIGHATVTAHAAGSFTAPAFESTTEATSIRADRFTWNKATATASGSPSSIGITVSAHGVETPSVEGSATVGVGAVTTITAADVTLRRRTTAMQVRVGKITVAQGLLDITDAEVTGVGEPVRGSFKSRNGVVTADALSAGVDLQQVAYIFRADDELKQGRAAFAVDVRSTGAHADGSARVLVSDLAVGTQKGVSVLAEATLHGREINGRVTASIAGLGDVKVNHASIHVGGTGPLVQSSWRTSWGDVSLQGTVDIAAAAALLPEGTLPPVDLSGTLAIAGHTSRTSATDNAPEVVFSLQTRHLHARGKAGWDVTGVDLMADVAVKGGSGKVTVRATDSVGPLFEADAASHDLPYAELVGPDGVAVLLRQPMTAHVHVPPRELATLPLVIRPDFMHAFVEVDATLTGTALVPVVKLDAAARGATFTAMPDAPPIDVTAQGSYAKKVGDVAVDVGSLHESHLHLTAHGAGDLGMLATGKVDPSWNTSARATLTHFPIGAFAGLANLDMRGRVSGVVELNRYHDDAKASAKISGDRFSIGRTRFTKAAVEATYDGNMLDAHARFDEKDGFADLTGKMAMGWGRELVPRPAPLDALSAKLTAKHFQASFLEPLLASAVDELDGLIDGDAHLELGLGKPPTMAGDILFHEGRVIPSATGEELHGINAKVTLLEDGTLSLSGFEARGTVGRVTGSGGAHLKGAAIADANLTLSVAKKDALPLALGGSVLGTGYGIVTMRAVRSGAGNTKVTIDVPTFHLDLPEATPHSVQDLDSPPDNMHIGVYTGQTQWKPLVKTRNEIEKSNAPEGRKQVDIALHLGTIDISRGTDLRATLGGDTGIVIAEKTSMHGLITLRSGTLAVQGKPFEIQKGTATFVGDPQNPEISLTASWKANDGTEVFADYVGPLKTGKVTLRSEPPRPQNEIVALILFGTSDGAQSTPYAQAQQADTTTTVGSTVGGFATGGLNKGIDKLTGMDISTKIDTSQANPRPEVELRIARDLSLQIAFVLGTPPQGTNPDTTFATIDWRFYRNWSLATTFGNLGSSMADVLWRYRY